MPKVQCKMCGGELTLPENAQNGTCEYCGSRVTFPKIADEHQENLYARAEHFRQMNDYDKALRAYEQIVTASPDDAEAYWGLVLCRYGIEYVKDPASGERIPTCHRVSYDSILADADYLAALEHAGSVERGIYESEAKRIADIQKGILAISAQEEPFDVFICYKESDDSGKRTRDSAAAQEIYYALTEQGYKVFFSRITLEKKLGQQYEPYIFAALNSAKVMLVVGSKPEYFNAVWVRNEWSRFLSLMKKDRSKLLIPCYRDMDAYDIPEELSMFQAQDMGRIGFIQDLLHGIAKVAKRGTAAAAPSAAPAAGGGNKPLLVRARLFLETGDFDSAREYCERVLDTEPENGGAYFLRLMAEREVADESELADRPGILDDKTFKLAEKFADPQLGQKLAAIRESIQKADEAERQWQMRTAEIEDASRKRINLIDRYLAAETTLHGTGGELYVELCNCREAESKLYSAPDPEVEPKVRAATENALARGGDLAELERAAAKRRRKRKLAAAAAVLLLLLALIIGSCCNSLYKKNRRLTQGVFGSEGKVLVKGPERPGRDYKIPDGVTTIGKKAFHGCKNLTSVTIPNSVTTIGDGAFWGCSNLTSVTIPASVKAIADSAFWGCKSLKSVTIPDSVTTIGWRAFGDCENLTSVTIPNSVTTIDSGAFWGCSNLESVTIPIGMWNIFDNHRLMSVTIQPGVTTIDKKAFRGSKFLASVTIPSTVTTIGGSAFEDCGNLASVTIPNSVTTIGPRAFLGCKSLSSVTIPNGVTTIAERTFVYCKSLKSVTIPDSVTAIGEYAFAGCDSLSSVTIPEGVTTIGKRTFVYCKSLKSVTIPDSVTAIGGSAFEDCGNLASVTIPNSVTTIGERAFYGCKKLKSVTIPDSVTTIGERAFENCPCEKQLKRDHPRLFR